MIRFTSIYKNFANFLATIGVLIAAFVGCASSGKPKVVLNLGVVSGNVDDNNITCEPTELSDLKMLLSSFSCHFERPSMIGDFYLCEFPVRKGHRILVLGNADDCPIVLKAFDDVRKEKEKSKNKM